MSKSVPAVLPLGQINENKVRLIAFFVLLSVGLYLLLPLGFIPALLSIDFGLRAFDWGKYSPFARLSEVLVDRLNLGVKPIYYPPKRFAARIGLGFSLAILILPWLGIHTFWVTLTLGFFAALESLAGICAGCYVYNALSFLWKKTGLSTKVASFLPSFYRSRKIVY